ncbi:hypothetical protein MHU86_12505 [Fragilaria crotonensis]|nr:hypothetical protein MHU86_12505 [Fragilaria crotonensis]
MDGVNPPRVPEAGDVPEFQAADGGDADIEAANGGDADPHAAVQVVAYLEAPDLGDDIIEAPHFGDDDPQADIKAADGGDADPQTVGRGEADPKAPDGGEDDPLAAAQGVPDPHSRDLDIFQCAIKSRKDADIAAVNASAAYELADRTEAYLADVTAKANVTKVNASFLQAGAVATATFAVEYANRKLQLCDQIAASMAREAALADQWADVQAKHLLLKSSFYQINNASFASYLEWFAAKTAARTALSVKWQEFMKSRSDIGMLTIMSMHRESYLWRKRWTQFLLFLVIAVQVTLPALLLVYSVQTYTLPNGCPMSANPIQKSVAGAIGCIYLVRIVSKMGSKAKEKLIGVKEEFRETLAPRGSIPGRHYGHVV